MCVHPAGTKTDCPKPGTNKEYVLIVDGEYAHWQPYDDEYIGKLLCQTNAPFDSQYPYCLAGVQGGDIFWKNRELCKTTPCSSHEDCYDDKSFGTCGKCNFKTGSCYEYPWREY